MQRCQAQVAGFGERHRMLHGFAITDFAHQNHVRRLPQAVLERDAPAIGVQPHFTLGDDAVFVRMHKFHGILNRDDVAEGVFVAPVHHGRQRGCLAAAGGPHQNHQPALGHGHILEDFRQFQLVNGWDFLRNHAQHHTHLAHLHEGIDTKTPDPRWRNGKVALLGSFKFRHLPVVHDRTHQRQRMCGRKGLRRYLADLAIHLDGGWKIGGDKQVTAIAADHEFEQFVYELAGLVTIHGVPSNTKQRVVGWLLVSRGNSPESWPWNGPRQQKSSCA